MKNLAFHPLLGPYGLVYESQDRVEIIADSLEHQLFTTINGPAHSIVIKNIQKLKNKIPKTNLCTSLGAIQKIIGHLAKKNAVGLDNISNAALNFYQRIKS